LAEARQLQADASKLNADARLKIRAANQDKVQHSQEAHEAQLLVPRALALTNATANQLKANELRFQAYCLNGKAGGLQAGASSELHKAGVLNQKAAELKKAAAQSKNQPAEAAALLKLAQINTDHAKPHDAQAAQFKAAAKTDDAKAAWAQ